MDSTRKGILSPTMLGLVSTAWVAGLSLVYLPAWSPLWCLSKQLPVVPEDIAASAVRLAMDGLPALAGLLLLATAALGAGSLALPLFRVDARRDERLVLSAGLGLGMVAYTVFLVGVTAGFGTIGRGVLLALLAAALVPGFLTVARAAREFDRRARGGWKGALFTASFALVAVYLLGKGLRPTIFYDAITYHLGVPNFFLLEGGIRYIPWDSCSNFPLTAEMLYALGLMSSGLKLAQLTGILPFLLSVLAVLVVSRRLTADGSGALPALFFLLTPGLLESTVFFTNDAHVYCFFLLAVLSFVLWTGDRRPGFLALAGAFTGLCLGTKYTALVLVLPPAALAAAHAAFEGRKTARGAWATNLLAFALPALLTWLPWPVRNLVNTGNPFYPAGFQFLGGRDMSAEQYAGILSMGGHPAPAESLRAFIRHPWDLFFLAPGDMATTYGNGAHLGLLIPLFVPLLLLVRDWNPMLRKLLLAAGVVYVFWNFSFVQTRYFYPAAALLLIAAACSFEAVGKAVPRPFRLFLAGAVAFHLLFNVCTGFRMVETWTATAGFDFLNESDDAYLLRRMRLGQGAFLDSYPVYRYVDERLGRDVRVLVIGDAQHLYLYRRHLYSYLSATTPFQVFADASGRQEEVAAWLASEDITHIVYNPGELRRLQGEGAVSYRPQDNGRIEEFLAGPHARLVTATRPPAMPVFLYEVVPPGPR